MSEQLQPRDHSEDWRNMIVFCEKEIEFWLDDRAASESERVEAVLAFAEIRRFYREQLGLSPDEVDLLIEDD